VILLDTVSDVELRIRLAYRQMAESDVDGLMTLYTSDAVIQNPNAPAIAGTSALRSFWTATLSAFSLQASADIQELIEFDGLIVVRGAVRGSMTPQSGGTPIHLDSWFQQIYRRAEDGSPRFWRGANGPNPSED
jgi:ketosteroid isomerase-like protein